MRTYTVVLSYMSKIMELHDIVQSDGATAAHVLGDIPPCVFKVTEYQPNVILDNSELSKWIAGLSGLPVTTVDRKARLVRKSMREKGIINSFTREQDRHGRLL